jgi:hypothetical protein
MRLIIYSALQASPREFVAFWASRYKYPKESLYTDNVGKRLTPTRIRALFEWKNGSRLSAGKLRSVQRNYVARVSELRKLPASTDAESFLRLFASGGAIWRIFWLHCWEPIRFPIYDQHVHRAMAFIESGERKEIPKNDASKVRAYLDKYLRFHRQFAGLDLRSVDRALWFYGKFIKSTEFPLLNNT